MPAAFLAMIIMLLAFGHGHAATVILEWDAPDTGPAPSGYEIERSIDGATYTLLGRTSGNITTFADTDVDPPRAFYRAYAYIIDAESRWHYSPPSNVFQADIITAPPLAPANLSARVIGPLNQAKTITITWPPSPHAESYAVYRKRGGTTTLAASVLTEQFTEQQPSGTTYCRYVVAKNVLGDSPTSHEICITTPHVAVDMQLQTIGPDNVQYPSLIHTMGTRKR